MIKGKECRPCTSCWLILFFGTVYSFQTEIYAIQLSQTDQNCHVICSEVRIEGLETLDYLDNLSDRKRFTEHGDAITFESEVYGLICGLMGSSICTAK